MNLSTIREIGRGGLAVVTLVSDEHNQQWALKQLLPAQTDPRVVSRFRHEVRILTGLAHPNIVPVVAAALDLERPFYIMPLADGSLEDEVSSIVLEPQRLVPIAAALLNALRYAHERGVLHRDIKPQNILRYGQLYQIADFGLSKAVSIPRTFHTSTRETWVSGWFSPPEQFDGLDQCDTRSDLFSLGRVLLYCLTGRTPSEVPSSIGREWQYLISKCLRDQKDDRWASAAVLQQQFELVFGLGKPLVVDSDGMLRWIASLAQLERELTPADVTELCQRVAVAISDNVLVRRILSVLTPKIVSAWFAGDPGSLKAFISTYDRSISPFEDFSYCDVIADQYEMIFKNTLDPEIRRLIRERLFVLGPSHNRWHVGQVFASVLATVRGPDEIAHVLSLAVTDRTAAKWNATYCTRVDIDQRIRAAMAGAAELSTIR